MVYSKYFIGNFPISLRAILLGSYMDAKRKVLLLTGHAVQSYKSTEEISLSELSTFTSIYTYTRAGVGISCAPAPTHTLSHTPKIHITYVYV